MELTNYHKTELTHGVDAITGSGSLGSLPPKILQQPTGPAPGGFVPSMPKPAPRPYPVIWPIYTPVVAVPYVEQVPVVPTLYTPVQNTGNNQARESSQQTETKIFGLKPLAAAGLVLGVLTVGMFVFKKQDQILALFK